MTAIARTRKEGELKSMTKQTPKSGKAKNGNDEKNNSCVRTLRVAVVEVSVRFPIIPTLRCTDAPNTLIYPLHDPIATAVIEVSTEACSDALTATKLFQDMKVKSALVVLKNAIRNVLNPDEPLVTMSATKPTEPRTGAVIRKKKSIPERENGK